MSRPGSLPLVHLGVTLLGVVASLVLLDSAAELALGVAAATAAYVMLVTLRRAYRLTGDALNVMSVSAVTLLLHFPLHALVMRDSAVVASLLGAERYESFTQGLLVAVAGTWFMDLGFRGGRRGRLAHAVERWSRSVDDASPQVVGRLLVFVGLAVAARVALVAGGTGTHINLAAEQGEFGALRNVLVALSAGGLTAGLYLLGTGLRQHRAQRTLLGVALVLAEAAWGGLFSGSRFQFFMPLLSAVALYSLTLHRIRMRPFLGMLGVFLVLALPLATAYRAAYNSQRIDMQRGGLSTDAVTASLESMELQRPSDSGWMEALGERFHGLLSLALVVRFTPERHPYTYGLPYALLPLDVAIPRFVWPDKPSIRQFTLDFRLAYFGRERDDETSIAVSMFGELWINLHLLGVVLGAWVWGRVLRFMYSFLAIGGRASMLGPVFYATALPSLIWVLEGQLVAGLAFVAKSLMVWLVWSWLLGRPRDHAVRPAIVAGGREPAAIAVGEVHRPH